MIDGKYFNNTPALSNAQVNCPEMKHDPVNCIVIEDSTNGIRAAKAAGIFCVGYNSENSKLQDLSLADVVVEHLDELSFDLISKY